MKLPGALTSFFSKKDTVETFLSLYLDIHSVAASFWQMNESGKVKTLASAHMPVKNDSWGDRTDAVDNLLGALEQKANIPDVTTTILGLPPVYLTSTGEIKKEIRPEIKELASDLELTLAGFVPLQQAIIFKLKIDEGVPPSVILLGVNTDTIAVSLYKIGTLVGVRDIEEHENIALDLEHGLKSFTELEVLPARILLYGSNEKQLETAKSKLMRHAWTTKANFLHFPKIEIVNFEMIVDAVSLAGASELKNEMGEDKSEMKTLESQVEKEAVGVASPEEVPKESEEAVSELTHEEKEDTLEAEASSDDTITAEVAAAKHAIDEDFTVEEEDHNVEMVDPAILGFKKNTDVLEYENKRGKQADVKGGDGTDNIVDEKEEDNDRRSFVSRKATAIFTSTGNTVQAIFRSFASGSKKKNIGLLVVVVVFAVFFGAAYWVLPHAVVTILEISSEIVREQSLVIDPAATTVETDKQIIPGRVREQSASGEKTVPVTGKKNVGDPARGSVTIYNKSLNGRTFKKGTLFTSGSLKFTLDNETEVASASESIGSLTFGKADAAVTAVAIGAQSNLPANSEFAIADTASSVASARNDAAFSGGTSREVVVVTRSDYDNFVKEISKELTEKAKQDLATTVSGGEQLIDETITTSVKEKVFDQELDQEATALSGKVTISVSGIAYSKDDISALFLPSISSELPAGYSVDGENMTISMSDVQVKKDGKITAKIRIHAIALPAIDTAGIPQAIAGKKLTDVQEYLKSIAGVGGMEIEFRFSPTKQRLPINKKNISVTVALHR